MISCSVLMSHSAAVVPQIAGQIPETVTDATVMAMRRAAEHVLAKEPDVLVVLSPHTPRNQKIFGLADNIMFEGELRGYDTAPIHVAVPTDLKARSTLLETAEQAGLALDLVPELQLDQGAMIPLIFLQRAGWRGHTLVINFPVYPTHEQCQALGRAIEKASKTLNQRWVIIAAGDLSHRLSAQVPSHYRSDRCQFDETFSKLIADGRLREAVEIDPELRSLAAEDVVDSVEVASAATAFEPKGCRVLSYGTSAGVGHLVAILYDADAAKSA